MWFDINSNLYYIYFYMILNFQAFLSGSHVQTSNSSPICQASDPAHKKNIGKNLTPYHI